MTQRSCVFKPSSVVESADLNNTREGQLPAASAYQPAASCT